jgi:5-(aminomethyl)-3-furanmethanol phosphate kinase
MSAIQNVLKIGGSLGRSQALGALCKEVGRLGSQHNLLVVPGGGEFADVVRDCYRRFQLNEITAHRMALLAMDQYGCLLGDLIPDSILVSDLLSARTVAKEGRIPILLPATLIIQADPLPHSWQVTSDSIAAWTASLVNASRLILLKVVDGLFTAPSLKSTQVELISEIDQKELASYPGGVDEYLSSLLATVNLETWIINGLYPSRLVELISSGWTTGTRVRQNGPENTDAKLLNETAH